MELPNLYRALEIIVLQLTVLIDSGRHDAITIGEARDHINRGDVMDWLSTFEPKRIFFEEFKATGVFPLEAREWLDALERQLNAYSMADDFGIEKRGLCMLLTLTVEQLRSEVDRVVEAARKKVQDVEGPPAPPRQH